MSPSKCQRSLGKVGCVKRRKNKAVAGPLSNHRGEPGVPPKPKILVFSGNGSEIEWGSFEVEKGLVSPA